MEQSYYRIEAPEGQPPGGPPGSGGRRSRSSRGGTPSFSSASGRSGPTSPPLLTGWPPHGEEADAVYAEELGLQLFPYMDDYACEVRAHLI